MRNQRAVVHSHHLFTIYRPTELPNRTYAYLLVVVPGQTLFLVALPLPFVARGTLPGHVRFTPFDPGLSCDLAHILIGMCSAHRLYRPPSTSKPRRLSVTYVRFSSHFRESRTPSDLQQQESLSHRRRSKSYERSLSVRDQSSCSCRSKA